MRNHTLETIRLVKQFGSFDVFIVRKIVMIKCKSFVSHPYLFASQIHAQLIFSIHDQKAILIFPSAPHQMTKNILTKSVNQLRPIVIFSPPLILKYMVIWFGWFTYKQLYVYISISTSQIEEKDPNQKSKRAEKLDYIPENEIVSKTCELTMK